MHDEEEVTLRAGAATIAATWTMPPTPRGVVVFAHGSGSSRFSKRNRFVADELVGAGFATLLLDLLTEAEDAVDRITAEHRFDIELLAERLAGGVRWLREQAETARLPIGLFGASTGAAAALICAAQYAGDIDAVVSRGGRPDLAGKSLAGVRAPTLLIVGGDDAPVLELNETALAQLTCPKELVVVRGATHLFEEPGALEHVASLAIQWFEDHLQPRATHAHV
jgi:putative phosphoribosyl transferase